MEAECEYRQQNMHCLEEELAETSKKSSETVSETRCDACRQIAEIKKKVYAKADKVEETWHAIRRQSE